MASQSNPKVPEGPDDHLAPATRPAKRKLDHEDEGEDKHEDEGDLPRKAGEMTQEGARTRRRKTKEKKGEQVEPGPEPEPEPDSILVLSDDAIRRVVKYLPLADLSTFEVCARLRRLITPLWDELLVDAENRTKARRPVPDDGFYCSKLSLMYLLRSVDRAVDTEERTRAGELFPATSYIRQKLYFNFRYCDHAFVRVSVTPEARNADGDSCRVAWQGFMRTGDWHRNYGYWGILYLPEEVKEEVNFYENLCKLLPQARALKEDFKALQREDITLSEWYERKETALAQLSGRIIISIVTTALTEKKGGRKFGAIVSETMTSSRLDGKPYVNPYSDTFHLWMVSSRKARMAKGVDGCIKLYCDDNVMRFRFLGEDEETKEKY